MALSNWDTLSFDDSGKPTDGELKNKDGGIVRIYKNWIYVSDPVMWDRTSHFVEPTICQIQNGWLTLAGFEINSVRCNRQNSVFCLVSWQEWKGKGDKIKLVATHKMAGIGCYGYRGRDFVGVEKKTLALFLNWLKGEDPEFAKKINPSNAQRFNQGDAYFKSQGLPVKPKTKVGKTEPTVLSRIMKVYK